MLPTALGTISAVKVPVVPTGGVPLSSAVPLPLSFRFNHAGGARIPKKLHETGVTAPLSVNCTWLKMPAVKVAPGEHVPNKGQPVMLAPGAGVTFSMNCCV